MALVGAAAHISSSSQPAPGPGLRKRLLTADLSRRARPMSDCCVLSPFSAGQGGAGTRPPRRHAETAAQCTAASYAPEPFKLRREPAGRVRKDTMHVITWWLGFRVWGVRHLVAGGSGFGV